MSSVIVSVTERLETAKTLDLYIRSTMPDRVVSYFMTYQGELLSGSLIRQADLFVVELFASDAIGPYTEGLFAAEKWLSLKKRALIVSGNACADQIKNQLYWDLAAADDLCNRIDAVIRSSPFPPSALESVRKNYSRYCRPAQDPHHQCF